MGKDFNFSLISIITKETLLKGRDMGKGQW
jgi:hypothetical protein